MTEMIIELEQQRDFSTSVFDWEKKEKTQEQLLFRGFFIASHSSSSDERKREEVEAHPLKTIKMHLCFCKRRRGVEGRLEMHSKKNR